MGCTSGRLEIAETALVKHLKQGIIKHVRFTACSFKQDTKIPVVYATLGRQTKIA